MGIVLTFDASFMLEPDSYVSNAVRKVSGFSLAFSGKSSSSVPPSADAADTGETPRDMLSDADIDHIIHRCYNECSIRVNQHPPPPCVGANQACASASTAMLFYGAWRPAGLFLRRL